MITAADVKLVQSKVMDDVPEGGGPPVSTVILDATSNSIMPDISELDRAGGRVNLRKVFVSVTTLDRDRFSGVNVIIAEPPADPLVSITLFSTGEVFDTREEAVSRVESYLNAGPEWPGFLYENHIQGQRSIQFFTRTTVAVPPTGRTVLLRMFEGAGNEFEQYVRITRVVSEERTFTFGGNQDYQALIVTCDISDPLRFDFPGTPANRDFVRNSAKTIIRDTVVADAANYFGVTPLTTAILTGDREMMVGSVYTPLVPNARTETPFSDQVPSGETRTTLATSPRLVQVPEAPFAQRIRIGQENVGFNFVTIVTPLPGPGTVRVTYRALGQNYSIVDNGDGTMSGSGAGTVNYLTGSISVTLQALPDDRSAVVFYWGQKSHYTNQSANVKFRLPEFSFDLEHSGLVPGSVVITWLSGAVLKTATVSSAGIISGDATGDVNHVSGFVHIRPTAMIDSGGEFSIDYSWSTQVEQAFPGLSPDGTGTVAFTLASLPVAGSVEITWLTTRTNSETSGVTTSSGSSHKVASETVVPTVTAITYVNATSVRYIPPVMYSGGSPGGYTTPKTEGDVRGNFDLYANPQIVVTKTPVTTTTHGNSAQGSSASAAKYATASSQSSAISTTTKHLVTDNGVGSLFGTFGTVSYGSGNVSVKVQADSSENSYNSNYENASNWESLNATSESTATVGGGAVATAQQGGGGATTAQGGASSSLSVKDVFGSNSLSVRYKTGSITPTAETETFTPPACVVDLCPYTRDLIVPGSVQFTWMGVPYQDFEGKLYRDRTTENPGVHAGGVSYTTGIATIFDYTVSGLATNFVLQSLWTRKQRGHQANTTFSTIIAPIKPGGLTLSVLDVSGNQIIATANTSGVITGTHTRGVIDFETGLVEMQFGDYVLDSGLTAAQKLEWWYDANDVRTADGKIWRPWPIDPETLRYSVVGYFYLPLDADILGLDPVRLPQDGKVTMFRPGGFLVVGHTATVGPVTVANTGTVNAGRVRLSRVRVIGSNGLLITTGYTANLNTGIVTFNDVTGYSQPITVEHRIEDMAVVAEVTISGKLTVTREISHDYPVPGSFVASALVAGDLRSRVSILFDQVSFNNIWLDIQQGSAATGTFDDTANPIEVTNRGALTERWAVVFTNTTSFNIIGEHVGVIATGNTSTNAAPLNPATATPYFTIPFAGWGLGWSTGNCLRFNTIGDFYPVWVVRTIQQGAETEPDDSFTILIRGDVDNPA